MKPQTSHFQRNFTMVLIVLFGLTLAALSYPSWAVDWGSEPVWIRLLNLLILSIPLVLLYGSLYLLGMGWHERARLGQLHPRLAGRIHWAPRIAALLIIFFVGLFSLDVLGMGGSPLEVLGGFLVHNIPSIVMLVMLIVAWRRPVVGFVAFLVAAAAFLLLTVRDIYALSNLVIFVLPLLLIALLFYADWQWVSE